MHVGNGENPSLTSKTYYQNYVISVVSVTYAVVKSLTKIYIPALTRNVKLSGTNRIYDGGEAETRESQASFQLFRLADH